MEIENSITLMNGCADLWQQDFFESHIFSGFQVCLVDTIFFVEGKVTQGYFATLMY